MSFVSECPSCGQKLKIPDNLAGKNVKCSKCATVFMAEAFTENAPPPAPRESEPIEEREGRNDDVGDEPVRRKRRRSQASAEESAAPGRGGVLMGLGIASIALPILAVCT